MKTLDDIRQDTTLQSKIHWDMKPRERIRRTQIENEEEMKKIEEELEARVGYFFYIDIKNRLSGLYLYENYPDGSGRFIAEITEIPEEMLQEAIKEAGGSVTIDGRYPINTSIKTWLKNHLKD
jgi:hypothetical protein